jgi:trk system potassium uptake protein TrkH
MFMALIGFEYGSNFSILKRLGISIFTTASAISTTGFVPDAANSLPLGVVIMSIMLIFIGGTAGSSAGGFKVLRFRVLFRQADSEISRLAHPHGIVAMRVNDMSVTNSILMSIWTLLILYLTSIALFSVAYGAMGYDMGTGIGLTVANLFSAGAMTDLIAPDFIGYAGMTYETRWLTSAIMILGRLEIITLLIFLTPSFRKY